MVAAEKLIGQKNGDSASCPECKGTGVVSYWSEITYFEDRRSCKRCEAGRKIDAKVSEIIKRFSFNRR